MDRDGDRAPFKNIILALHLMQQLHFYESILNKPAFHYGWRNLVKHNREENVSYFKCYPCSGRNPPQIRGHHPLP